MSRALKRTPRCLVRRFESWAGPVAQLRLIITVFTILKSSVRQMELTKNAKRLSRTVATSWGFPSTTL
jgi:hypothetical protein